jgi:enamine deaminase RidA (YjgF/YER057c/UK114 family)
MIKRLHSNKRMSQMVIYNQVVHLAGQVDETAKGGSADEQTRNILNQIDALLAEAGTNKSKLLMNQAWEAWIDPANPPTRATVGVTALAGDEFSVEIVVSAAV